MEATTQGPAETGTSILDAPTDTPQSEGHISVDAGGSAVSFDELESLDATHQESIKTEAKIEAQKEVLKDEIKTKDAGKEAKAEAKTAEPDKTQRKDKETESGAEAKEAGGEQTTEPEGDTEGTGKNKQGRAYKTTIDGKEVSLTPDTVFKHKVDGELQDITLQDALNSFSGHKAIDRRFSELNVEKQNFLAEKTNVDDNINKIFSLANENKPKEALFTFFEGLGVDPTQAMGTLRDQMMEEATKLAGMSEPERIAYNSEQQAETLKTQLESYKAQEQTRVQQTELQTSIVTLQEKHSVDDETFNGIAEELLSLKEQGKISQQITPELIVEVAISDRNTNQATKLLTEINPDIAVQDNVDKITRMLQSGMSVDDIKEWASVKWGQSSPAEVLSEKVRQTETNETVAKDPMNEDVWGFDQL